MIPALGYMVAAYIVLRLIEIVSAEKPVHAAVRFWALLTLAVVGYGVVVLATAERGVASALGVM